jgi:hypothetical protein
MTYLKLNSSVPVPKGPVVAHPYYGSSRSADSTAPQTREASPTTDPLRAA